MMSADRTAGPLQGRIRGQPLSGRSNASPLTPRLAANATATKRDPSPRRPFVKAGSSSRSTSPEKRAETPARSLTADLVTPRSSAARPKLARPGSTLSTPGSATPGSTRGGTIYASPRLAPVQTPAERDARGGSRSVLNLDTPYRRDFATPSPLSQDPLSSAAHPMLDAAASKSANAMFFHASEAKSQDLGTPPLAPPPAKRPAFIYANGQREEQHSPGLNRTNSAGLTMSTDRRNIVLNPRGVAASELGLYSRPRVISPTGSALSHNKSVSSPSSDTRSPSPTKMDYLNTPYATINHQRLRDRPVESVSFRSPVVDALGVSFEGESRPMYGSPRGHNKSMSICAIPSESPGSARKRSATWTELQGEHDSPHTKSATAYDASPPPQMASPILGRPNIASGLTSPIISDPLQSPSKELIDYATDARRERKVLDLEISNSSLLAINKTLEREVKKHKAELKRYRRLSRAGRFSVAPGAMPFDEDADGYDVLPHIDGAFVGRPSSPFEEDVSDMDVSDDEQSTENEDGSMSPNAQATKEQRQRAKDEAQLRNDLRKHRELLLDTARMNRSLQRCLTWTEDLIKDGKKALSHQVRSEEVRLGGRVLDEDDAVEDDIITASAEFDVDPVDSPSDGDEATETPADDFTSIEAFLGMGPWQQQQQHGNSAQKLQHRATSSESMSIDSESTNRDSGVEMQKHVRRHAPPRQGVGAG